MPKLNLRDDGFEEESNPLDSDQSVAPPPTLREVGVSGGGGKSSTLLTAILLIVVVGGGVFALNYFKVIHLWGKRTPKISTEAMTDQLPVPETPVQGANATDQGSTAAPAPDASTQTPEPSLEPSAATPTPSTSTPVPTTSRPSRKSEATPASKFVPPPSGSGNYTVQVSSWTSKEMAEKEASRLNTAGMSAFVEDAVIAGENWYRVRVGRYGSSKEAKEAADQLAKSMEGQIWVAKVSAK
ncbi:MAG TPA: SPOR domain-containing protein [Bacteroidota bacterium]|nr:SPOR domain-containing protein [Bacteroidota bacterium]